MRESDRILAEDLREVGLHSMAARAEAGEWNDFFGLHTFPQMELISELVRPSTHGGGFWTPAVRQSLIDRVIQGKYDATPGEADEWAAGPEGQGTFGKLIRTARTEPG